MSGPVIIRAPNHLGDLVMALPALEAGAGADVMVVRWLVPILELSREGSATGGGIGRILPLDRGPAGTRRAATALRAGRYRRGILLSASFSAAMLFFLGRIPKRRGTPTDGRSMLLTERVDLSRYETRHRALSYLALVTGTDFGETPTPSLRVAEADRASWAELVEPSTDPLVGVFPGSHASSRRWDAERYAELVLRLARRGIRVAVFGGASERDLTRQVAGGEGLDLGGRTDLRTLAAGLSACDLLVTNDSGPMHLAAAVGTRTLSLQGPADPRVTRPLGEGHRMLQAEGLPCLPCVKNECPRSGRGYRLAEAHRECMRLIDVDAVDAAVSRQWDVPVIPTRETDRG